MTPLAATQENSGGLLVSDTDEVEEIGGEKFFRGIFFSTEMSEEKYLTSHEGIVVRDSNLHGRGVFATKSLKEGFLTAYPGELIHKTNLKGKANDDQDYVLEVYPGCFVDAKNEPFDKEPVGHILNSSHPNIPNFTSPNCSYIPILVTAFDGSKSILPGVYLNIDVDEGTELLCDYHWRLLSVFPCSCDHVDCVEARDGASTDIILGAVDDNLSIVSPMTGDICVEKVVTPLPSFITNALEVATTPSQRNRHNVRTSTMKARKSDIARYNIDSLMFACIIVALRRKLEEKGKECRETNCGKFYQASEPFVAVRTETSGINRKNAGLGLILMVDCKNRQKVGNFGGMLLCGLCVKKRKGKRPFDTLLVEQDFENTFETTGVYWHLCRTGVVHIDGYMWYINSSRKGNPIGYRNPNTVFECCGFYDDGSPGIEVYTSKNIVKETELLADYMSKMK